MFESICFYLLVAKASGGQYFEGGNFFSTNGMVMPRRKRSISSLSNFILEDRYSMTFPTDDGTTASLGISGQAYFSTVFPNEVPA